MLRRLFSDKRGDGTVNTYLLLSAAGSVMCGLVAPSLYESSKKCSNTFEKQVEVLEKGASPSGGGMGGLGGGMGGLGGNPLSGLMGSMGGGGGGGGGSMTNSGGSITGSGGSLTSGSGDALSTGGQLTVTGGNGNGGGDGEQGNNKGVVVKRLPDVRTK